MIVTSGYVAENTNMNPKACIPFDGITENRWEQLRGSLDLPRYRWWRCRSCVRELVTSSTTAQDFSIKLRVDGGSQRKNNTKPPAKDMNKVDSIGGWAWTLVLFNFLIFETFNVYEATYSREDCDKESDNLKRFVADAEQPLFEGSKCTKHESVLKLHNWKARFGVSDKAFTDLLQSIGSILPKDNLLPSNMGPILESSSERPKCHLSRWKVGKDSQVWVNAPAKVMWYFPIIPKFKRMFKSSSTAKLMSWHANNRSKDGKMRHPSDSPSWKNVDCRSPKFGSEARNIRLGLAADGLQDPGHDINVYLQPLIDDLKKLWEEGEPNVYDAHTKSFFTLKEILMWTINDFPGYGNLSGCVNKGYRACPVYGDQTVAKYLSRSRKMSYQGHRRYLDLYHPYRRQWTAFIGEQKFGCAPEPLSGEEVLGQQQQLRFSFGKGKAKKDVMHVEKNVCDNIIGTLLHMKFKSKDSLASHLDLVDMGIRPDLAPEIGEKRTYLPPAPYTLSRKEKQTILASLYGMKLPYVHASNIRNCVSMIDMKLCGLKSHDHHILLQQLLPVWFKVP
ncbi:uncharacterized protein LOC141673368 [Apium graveolens]|uniref:uncharacterized protein LOC141673368 n=1 Tax=Apium graveolens TaxID=4045 RepID=UPI003D7AAC8B